MDVVEFPKKSEAAEPVVSPKDALKMLQVAAAQMVADADMISIWKNVEGETATVFFKLEVSMPTETASQWIESLEILKSYRID